MLHSSYNFYLLIASVIVAVVTCFIAFSLDLIFDRNALLKKIKKGVWLLSGLSLGLAIWLMHFIGMMAGHLPETHSFNYILTLLSYVVAAISSILAIWLNSREHISVARLIIGSILMGAGITGMHYIGMLSLIIPAYKIVYSPTIVILSTLVAIIGSGLSFWIGFKAKRKNAYDVKMRLVVAVTLALTIVSMHYIGMMAVDFIQITNVGVLNEYSLNQGFILSVIVLIISLVLVSGLFLATLELRLDEKNKELIKLNEELAHIAFQDHLTKLPNRFYLDEYVEHILVKHRNSHQQIAFIYIDIDHFKVINDAFGHCIADKLLLVIVERLKVLINERSQLIRLGGDEFVLVVEESYLTEAVHITDNLLKSMKEGYLIDDQDIKTSLSVGIAMYPEHGENLKKLLINADLAMHLSKEQGRNTFRVYNETMNPDQIISDYTLTHDLNTALEEHQFTLFYQPKFNSKYQIRGVEALIRWMHPVKGQISPLQFIDLAEKTGLIIPIGYWVIEDVCRQIQEWKRNKQTFYPIAINLSARQFEHPQLIDTLKRLMLEYEVDTSEIMLEITENTILQSVEINQHTFQNLKNMGIKMVIDDFGTGYASFAYLKDFAFDELKIDRGFITHLVPDSKEEAILESIIHLSIKLGLKVTAEGVETQEQADILLRLGCHQLQGFLLAKPMSAKHLEQFKPI